MLNALFERNLENANEAQLKSALKLLLKPHATPVFGAAKTIEHEVAALNALKVLGIISPDAEAFDLVEQLRVTKSKARSLLYQAALRTDFNKDIVNKSLIKALSTAQVVRTGELYLLEVPDPLTMDRLRKRVRNYGFLTDGSFSGTIAKIPEGALIKLVEDLVPEEEKKEIIKQLIKAGMPDKTIASVIKAMLSQAGKKVAGDLGTVQVLFLGDAISSAITSGWHVLKNYVGAK